MSRTRPEILICSFFRFFFFFFRSWLFGWNRDLLVIWLQTLDLPTCSEKNVWSHLEVDTSKEVLQEGTHLQIQTPNCLNLEKNGKMSTPHWSLDSRSGFDSSQWKHRSLPDWHPPICLDSFTSLFNQLHSISVILLGSQKAEMKQNFQNQKPRQKILPQQFRNGGSPGNKTTERRDSRNFYDIVDRCSGWGEGHGKIWREICRCLDRISAIVQSQKANCSHKFLFRISENAFTNETGVFGGTSHARSEETADVRASSQVCKVDGQGVHPDPRVETGSRIWFVQVCFANFEGELRDEGAFEWTRCKKYPSFGGRPFE